MTVDRLHAVLSAIGRSPPAATAASAAGSAGSAGGAGPTWTWTADEPQVTPRELAEILWLAAHIAAHDGTDPTDVAERRGAADPAASSGRPQGDQDGEPPADADAADSAAASADSAGDRAGEATGPDAGSGAGERGLYGPSAAGSGGDGTSATGVLVPTAPMLDHPLAIQRALRPLKRRVPSRRAGVIDEEATAARIAEQPVGARPWVPVLTASPERWLSLVLVVDVSPSMRMWRPLARELHETLIRLGAFRDLRVRYLVATTGRRTRIGVASAPDAPPMDVATVIDPSGRQAILVLSDCSGPHWWDGRADVALRQWARAGPAAVLQPLAERLWRRTALAAVPGNVVAARACAPNSALRFTPYDGVQGTPPGAVAVPVLECAPGWLADWAAMVAGGGPGRPAAIAYVGVGGRGDIAPLRHERELPIRQRVLRFQTTASPAAARLAAHVAVSFPALPVMRLIQHRILHDPRPGHLAEVLLSGLLRPIDGDAGWYEFVPGAREALLTTLPRSESWHTADVLGRISSEIERRAGTGAETFPAYLSNAGPADAADAGEHAIGPDGRPFALVSAEAVRLLSRTALHVPEVVEPAETTEAEAAETEVVETELVEAELVEEPPRPSWPIETVRLLDLPEYRPLQTADPAEPAVLWANRSERDFLRVTFGVDPLGRPVTLDFKETDRGGMGPHGMLAWSRGAGKAEILRTLVLSLALTHSPEQVNFLLVGFGGGVTARGLDNLPHTSQVVTGLRRVGQVGRALRAELARRRDLLGPGRSASRYQRDYEAARARGLLLDPLPVILVLVDEAFELEQIQPEFVDVLAEIGERGAALGIHLLLAGEQVHRRELRRLERYLSYRICLRTRSAADSEIVLGNTDAYHLRAPAGHGILKVGTAVYQRFRAAYTGADADDIIRRLTGAGPKARDLLPPRGLPPTLDSPVTLDELLPDLALVPDRGFTAGRRTGLSTAVGVVRRPGPHCEPHWLDLFGERGNLGVAGAKASGKSRFLATVVASLALTHTPREARFYCLDFGGGLLTILNGLPHVGDVVTALNPDGARRIVTAVARLLEGRRTWPSGPEIFLVVDRWRTIRADFPDLVPIIAELAARGPRLGIHVLLSTRTWADLPADLLHRLGVRIELRLEDPAASLFDPEQAAGVPPMSGRGLVLDGEHFLAALPRVDGNATFDDLPNGVENLVARVRTAWDGPTAPPLPDLDRPAPAPESARESAPAPGSAPVEGDRGERTAAGAGGESRRAARQELPSVKLWGAAGSGKTTFLAALNVATLRAEDDMRVSGVDPESVDFLVMMTDIMTRHRAFPLATEQVHELSWTVEGVTERTVRGRFRRRKEVVPTRFRLDLVDAPGGSYAGPAAATASASSSSSSDAFEYAGDVDAPQPDPLGGEGRFIAELTAAAGLIYLFDPLREGDDQFPFFLRMIQLMALHADRDGRAEGRLEGRLPHYLAVCVTKFDDLRVFTIAERLGFLTTDPDDELQVPRVAADRAEDLFLALGRWSPAGSALRINDAIRRYFRPDRVRYFVTSSIGFYIGREARRFRGDDFENVVRVDESRRSIRGDVHPIDVLEPVRWLGNSIGVTRP